MKHITSLTLLFGLLLVPTVSTAQTPVNYVDGQPVYCADADCGIGDGAEPINSSDNDTNDNRVIRAGDSSGKMVSIYGGQQGRDVLHYFIDRSNDQTLTDRQRLIAGLLQQILINRWYELSQ